MLRQWLDRETLSLWKTILSDFKDVFEKSVAVMLDDCFEIFMNKPSSLDSRAIVWSNYKHYHTAKVLVGITPTGVVCFLSLCWGGRTLNKHIVAECALFSLLLPCDVLAVGGFDITKYVALFHARSLILAFTKG